VALDWLKKRGKQEGKAISYLKSSENSFRGQRKGQALFNHHLEFVNQVGKSPHSQLAILPGKGYDSRAIKRRRLIEKSFRYRQ